MTISNLGEILLALVALGWIVSRQMTWRPVGTGRDVRMPLVIAVVGVAMLASTGGADVVAAPDALVLLGELAVSAVFGTLLGALAHLRTVGGAERAADADAGDLVESRTGWIGAAVWIALLAVRLLVHVLTLQAGLALAGSTGVVLVMIAATRLVQAYVVRSRAARVGIVPARA